MRSILGKRRKVLAKYRGPIFCHFPLMATTSLFVPWYMRFHALVLIGTLGLVLTLASFFVTVPRAVAVYHPMGHDVTAQSSLQPAVASPDSSWTSLAKLRHQLDCCSTAESASLKRILASLQSLVDQPQDPSVATAAYHMMVDCYMRLGDKQTALEAFLARGEVAGPAGRESVAWELVRWARVESRSGGGLLASEQLDQFFVHFSDTQADDAALLLGAQVHQELMDWEAAAGFYRTHIARHPDSPMRQFASIWLAELYRQHGRGDLSAKILADWEQERIRRDNLPALAPAPPQTMPSGSKPCPICGH